MAKKKTPAKTQAQTKKAITASVERARERAKIKPAENEKHIKNQLDLIGLTKAELTMQMGTIAFELAKIQERMGRLNAQHNALQGRAQAITREIDKRG